MKSSGWMLPGAVIFLTIFYLKYFLLQFVLLSLAMLAGMASAASPGLSHVVRVGRNGRQVVRNKVAAGGQGGGKRRVVRRKQNRPRQSRQFFSPAPAPLTFALPPPPAPAPIRVAPAPVRAAPAAFTAFNPFRAIAAPVAPVAPAVRVAPAPFLAPVPVAPLPLTAHHHVQVSHLAHPAPLPVPAPAPAVEVVELQAVPVQREYGAPSTVAPEVRNTYLAPELEEEEEEVEVVEVEVARDAEIGYLAPLEEELEVEAARDAETSYLAPAEEVEVVEVEAARDAEQSYLAPQESGIAVPDATTAAPAVVEAKSAYIAALPSASVEEYVPRTKEVRPEPIGIVRFNMNSPAEKKEFDYSFEAENGHKQEAVGTMRRVDDTDVAVMKGSYEYIGSDGLTYVVDWYADETGFHPTAP